MSRILQIIKERISEDLIAECTDGILAVDPDLRYVIWNPAMERLSGLGAEDVLGKPCLEVFPFLKEIGEDEAIRRCVLAGERMLTHNRPYSTAAGRQGFFDGVYSPIRSDEGDVVAAIGLIRDATERALIQEFRSPASRAVDLSEAMPAQRKTKLAVALGRVIHEKRKMLGISQERLAEKSCLHRTYITDIERGARSISVATLEKIAGALGIRGWVLLGLADSQLQEQ